MTTTAAAAAMMKNFSKTFVSFCSFESFFFGNLLICLRREDSWGEVVVGVAGCHQISVEFMGLENMANLSNMSID